MVDIPRTCPRCGSPLKKWSVPEGTTWSEEYFLVCFNDDCPYFKAGWVWMREQYSQNASYRYMVSPITGVSSQLPVWSRSAMREMIVEDAGGDDE